MKQTALEELIGYINSFSNDYPASKKQILTKATELLTKERAQHTKTYTAGFYAGCDQPMMDNMPVEYFSTTYKQPL